jgi:hypothetical protein
MEVGWIDVFVYSTPIDGDPYRAFLTSSYPDDGGPSIPTPIVDRRIFLSACKTSLDCSPPNPPLHTTC